MFPALIIAALVLLGACLGLAVLLGRLATRTRTILAERRDLDELVQRSNDALFVIDLVNGAVLRHNPKAAQLVGRSDEPLHGLTIFQLVPPQFLMQSAERIAQAWEQDGLVFEDVPFLHRHGGVIPVECSTRVSGFKGRPAIILSVRDISERQRLQGEITAQQEVIARKNDDLLASLRYAETIQRAVLPGQDAFEPLVSEGFILYEPKDIVGGDLYWFARKDQRLIVAAADCTGHGVPGALMSMIGTTLLSEIVERSATCAPQDILGQLRVGILDAMGAGDAGSNGMDIALVVIDREARTLDYAGANLPCLIVRTGQSGVHLLELEPDHMPIGVHPHMHEPFTGQHIALAADDRVYLFSDGITDQFGGPKGRKLKRAGFNEIIRRAHALPMREQRTAIARSLADWQGDQEQVDDMLLIGFRA